MSYGKVTVKVTGENAVVHKRVDEKSELDNSLHGKTLAGQVLMKASEKEGFFWVFIDARSAMYCVNTQFLLPIVVEEEVVPDLQSGMIITLTTFSICFVLISTLVLIPV